MRKNRIIGQKQSSFISDRIHKLNSPQNQKTVLAALQKFAEEQGHTRPPEGFKPIRKGSYFELIRDWNEPTSDPSVVGRRMADVRCVCGTELTLPYRIVGQLYKTSCGCRELRTEDRIALHQKHVHRLPRRMEDLRNSGPNHDGVHGLLKVEDFLLKNEHVLWQIKCACGKKFELTRQRFLRKQTDTCGSSQCLSLLAQGYTREHAVRMFQAARRATIDPRLFSIVKPVPE